MRVGFGEPRELFFVIDRIRRMFDLDSDWAVIARTLRHDPELAQIADGESGLRVPGCWSDCELTVRAILGQATSAKKATMMAGRVVKACSRALATTNGITHIFPTAEKLADAALAGAGVPRATAATLRAFAQAVCVGKIRFEGIVDGSDFPKRLREIPGIGKWTAQYAAMSVLRDPDPFPSGDIALQRAIGERSAGDLEKRSEAWRPWRSYAAMLLWQSNGNVLR